MSKNISKYLHQQMDKEAGKAHSQKRTKIVATVGPACDTYEGLLAEHDAVDSGQVFHGSLSDRLDFCLFKKDDECPDGFGTVHARFLKARRSVRVFAATDQAWNAWANRSCACQRGPSAAKRRIEKTCHSERSSLRAKAGGNGVEEPLTFSSGEGGAAHERAQSSAPPPPTDARGSSTPFPPAFARRELRSE